MKVAVYNLRADEREFFDRFAPIYGAEIVPITASPGPETAALAEGCPCISVITDTYIGKDLLERFHACGVRFLSTRTIGYDHLDLETARAMGFSAANVTYTPDSVADYAIMLMLMVLRKAKAILVRAAGQDYTISGVRGRQLPNLTVGVVGTGRIGATVVRHLSGFGCRVLCTGLVEDPSLAGLCRYVTLDELLAQSDIVTLHVPSSPENYHLMDASAFGKMKEGAVLINTARGDLVDSEALLAALEAGKLWGAGLDVVEGDREIYYRDMKDRVIPHRAMAALNAMPNVVLTPHMAFYTDQAVSDMVENSLKSCAAFCSGAPIPGKLI